MFSAISRAFAEAFRNLRNNFFQTFLSVLGIIIGVGALVAMLAMIDGLEAYAKDKISERSSLENLVIVPNEGTRIDGIYTPRDTIAQLTPTLMAELLDSLPYHRVHRRQRKTRSALQRRNPSPARTTSRQPPPGRCLANPGR